ncbi:MAG TPA: redoxin domain-containing protein [Epsilonproteobacteria bacterium]|nr:redoxin domain-containing protein [Campylobacterota bacterium]
MKKWNAKKILKEMAIGAVAVFILSNIISYVRKPNLESNILPTQTFELIDGTTYTPQKGKPLLIHFWATWCHVCSLEAANVQNVSEKYEVLTVAVQSGSTENIKAKMKKEGVSFRVVEDPQGLLAGQFKVSAYPTDFIYNAKGKLQSTDVGYTTTAGLLARMKMAE